MSAHSFHIFAPAKLNLFLHVTGRRDDGYHLLQSLMGFVDVGDDLEFSLYDGLFIDVTGPFAAPLSDLKENLVYKAAVLLAEEYKVPLRGKITLNKNLPVSSGMGGGSTDAAATLRGLVRLWGLFDESGRLHRLAQQLGADVPACLYHKLAWVEGVGEKIIRQPDMPDIHFVLVNPMIPTPTPEVFRHFNRPFSEPLQFSGRRKTTAEWIADLKIYNNDLTEAACAVTPVIRKVLAALAGTSECLLHRLSGSGATCFGIYGSAEAALAAASELQARHAGWWVTKAGMLK